VVIREVELLPSSSRLKMRVANTCIFILVGLKMVRPKKWLAHILHHLLEEISVGGLAGRRLAHLTGARVERARMAS
jgi:hypothetical protein